MVEGQEADSAFPNFSSNKYRESVSRIYDMQLDTLLVAHGEQVNLVNGVWASVDECTKKACDTLAVTKIK